MMWRKMLAVKTRERKGKLKCLGYWLGFPYPTDVGPAIRSWFSLTANCMEYAILLCGMCCVLCNMLYCSCMTNAQRTQQVFENQNVETTHRTYFETIKQNTICQKMEQHVQFEKNTALHE